MRSRPFNKKEFAETANTLIRDVKAKAADRISLEIGDSKQPEFIPQAKITRWDNEVNFSVRRDNGARAFTVRDGKIVAESAKEDVVFYELEADELNEDGGLEVELHLKERPDTNVFEFTVQTKGLDFFYQPPLTPEEIEQGAFRPENVEGSYAVYHKTGRNNRVGGMEYKTGKAFHIYRPHVTDAEGKETWAELSIDEKRGVLSVTVPEEYLARAVYPVIVDPTFGYTSSGASASQIAQRATSPAYISLRSGSVFTAPENGDIDSISAYSNNNASAGSRNVDTTYFVNERDSIASNSHGEVSSAETLNLAYTTSTTLKTISATGSIVGGTEYVLNAVANPGDLGASGHQTQVRYDSSSDPWYTETFSGASTQYSVAKESPWTDSASSNRTYSIYVTYTATASDPDPLVANQASFTLTGQSAGLHRALKLTASTGSFMLAGQPVQLTVGRTLTASHASFAHNGQSASLFFEHFLSAQQASFTLAEQNAGLLRGYTLTADQASLSLTGQANAFTRALRLTAVHASFVHTGIPITFDADRLIYMQKGDITLTGYEATFTRAYRVIADTGSFEADGQPSALVRNYPLIAEQGSFAQNGLLVAFSRQLVVSAETGDYALSGAEIDLLKAFPLTAEHASFSLAGQDAVLLVERALEAEQTAFTLTAQDAELFPTKRLQVDAGEFAFSGYDIAYSRTYVLSAEPGTLTTTGIPVTFDTARQIYLQQGGFSLAGGDAGFTRARRLQAQPGAFTHTGQSALLRYARVMQATTRMYMLVEIDADLVRALEISALRATYTLTGRNAQLRKVIVVAVSAGDFTLSGQTAYLRRGYLLDADNRGYTLSGQASVLLFARELETEALMLALTGRNARLRVAPSTNPYCPSPSPYTKQSGHEEMDGPYSPMVSPLEDADDPYRPFRDGGCV